MPLGSTPDLAPFIENVEAAPAFWMYDSRWTILVDSRRTGGAFCVMEQRMRRGVGPIPHIHHYSDEWFQVLDGTLDLTVGGETMAAKAGDTVWIPRGSVHAFKVTSEECRVLNGYTPGGFEQVIRSLATPASGPGLPPAGFPKPDERTATLMFSNYWACDADVGWAGVEPSPR